MAGTMDALTATSLRSWRSIMPERVHLNQKRTLFCLRGVISLVMVFFLVYHPDIERNSLRIPLLLLLAHLASNIALLRLPDSWLEKPSTQAGVFLFDIAAISCLIFVCEGFDGDLFLIYFVVVLMSGLQMRIWQSLLIGLAACAVYMTLWGKSNPEAVWDAHILLRLPFFYIVAVFAAFFAQQTREREERTKEASLKEERAKLRTVFGQMKDAALLTDGQGRIVLCNDAARKFFEIGTTPSGSVAEHLARLKVEPPVPALLASPEPSVDFEAVREEPKRLVLAGTATLLRFDTVGDTSAWNGHLLVFRDVTAERQEGLIKQSFLFLISHKLRTPLTLIIGFAELLLGRKNPAPMEPAQREKALDNILTHGLKLSDLVNRLLDFIAIESLEPGRLDRQAFSVAEAVQDAVKALAPWLAEHQAVLETEVDPALKAFGDQTLIRRAFQNLIENAVKFNSKPEKKVVVRAAARDGTIEASVQDRGDGIPPEDREAIFRRFHQVEPSFTGNVQGWGLGLPFVKKVVEHHGGKVSVESSLTEGTTVSFTLPAAAEPARESRAAA
ncbi:MAG: PAS domain-containing protein [Elusimicrobia bacterium]|nr:PAS domain-containing protein [Elusimicrobiota bacterium]